MSFTEKLFIVMKSNLLIPCFMDHVFNVVSKNPTNPKLLSFSPVIIGFSCLHLYVCGSLESIFMKGVRPVPRLIFFAGGCPVVPASFVGFHAIFQLSCLSILTHFRSALYMLSFYLPVMCIVYIFLQFVTGIFTFLWIIFILTKAFNFSHIHLS